MTAERFTSDDVALLRSQADWYEEMTPDVVYACPDEMKPAWQLRNLADRVALELTIPRDVEKGGKTP